jgi:hypothetical protein
MVILLSWMVSSSLLSIRVTLTTYTAHSHIHHIYLLKTVIRQWKYSTLKLRHIVPNFHASSSLRKLFFSSFLTSFSFVLSYIYIVSIALTAVHNCFYFLLSFFPLHLRICFPFFFMWMYMNMLVFYNFSFFIMSKTKKVFNSNSTWS